MCVMVQASVLKAQVGVYHSFLTEVQAKRSPLLQGQCLVHGGWAFTPNFTYVDLGFGRRQHNFYPVLHVYLYFVQDIHRTSLQPFHVRCVTLIGREASISRCTAHYCHEALLQYIDFV